MRKKIIITSILLFLGFLTYQVYVFYISPTNNLQSIYLIPKDAVYIVETQKPIDNLDKISQSEIWKHLQTNDYFNDLTKGLNKLDTLFNQKKKLFNIIGNRSLLISAHMYKEKAYGLFYVVDLQKISKLKLLKNNLKSFVNDNFRVSSRKYHSHEITEIYDKKSRETLSIAFIKNQLIASYVHKLVESSIDEFEEPIIGRDLNFIEINKKVGFDAMFRLYFQYDYLDDYMRYFSDKSNNIVSNLSKNLTYSGFNFNLKSNNVIFATGYTNTNQKTAGYLKALQKSGKGKRTIAKIAPKRTAFYLSFGFDSFAEFYTNFENIQKENSKQFAIYQDNIDKIENLLKISIKDNFISWVDDEIALLQLQSSINKDENEIALVLKATEISKAKENLDFILKRIKKRTPVKFKTINYKEHQINFMSIKGFFKVLLGNMFDKFDKPYFTIIDDYVVFSNHPNTLKSIIDDYLNKETLSKSNDFQSFNNYFDKKSSVFAYINTPTLYKNLYAFADKNTKKKILKNKDYIICFPQIGFQFTPYDNMFESKFVVSYQDPEIVKNKDQYRNLPFIGPATIQSQNNSNNTISSNQNLIVIDNDNLFKIAPINPNDLNADEYKINYTTGNIHIKVPLKNGMKHGMYRLYYPNGKIKLKGRFKKDKQTGTWRYYDVDGKLIAKKRF